MPSISKTVKVGSSREIATYTDDQLDEYLSQLRRPGEPIILDFGDSGAENLPPGFIQRLR